MEGSAPSRSFESACCYLAGQTGGRSAGLPVHWPECPAPFPPLVGDEASAQAVAPTPLSKAVVATMAAIRRFIDDPFLLTS